MSLGVGWLSLLFIFGCVCLLIFLRSWRQRFHSPAVLIGADFTEKLPRSLRARCALLPHFLKLAALVLFLLAFLDPHRFIPRTNGSMPPTEPHEGIALYLDVDHSGSMGDELGNLGKSKIEALKEVATAFIKDRSQDMIGLIEFARVPTVLEPLTLDHESLIKRLDAIKITK